jgi:RNA polymerase sigma-70 factor (ECF subfamily)
MVATTGHLANRLLDAPGAGGGARRIVDLFRELDGALRKFLLRRVRCPHDADDLAQEVYLRIARHPDLDRVECLRAFAYQTALNLVRDRSRRTYTRSRRRFVPIDSLELADGDDPFDHAVGDERLAQLDSALAAMSLSRREALLMHRFGGSTYAEIAKRLGVSVSMVEKYISAALAELREPSDATGPGCRRSTLGRAAST